MLLKSKARALMALFLLTAIACSHNGPISKNFGSKNVPATSAPIDFATNTDANRDGHIEPFELEEGMTALFNELDKDRDGVLSADEAKSHKWTTHLNGNVTIMQFLDGAQKQFNSLDKTKSGKIAKENIRDL